MSLVRKKSPVEGVLLSLTCKSVWSQVKLQSTDVLYKLKRCLSLDQTIYFLRMLEKDSSRYIVCTACLRLHTRKKNEDQFVYFGSITKPIRPCSSEIGVTTMQGKSLNFLRVHREAVELILRAAALGPKYGPSLAILKRSRGWDVFSVTHFKVKFNSVGAIARSRDGVDHLLLKGDYSFEVDLRRPLMDQISDASIGGCQHNPLNQKKSIVRAIEAAQASIRSDPFSALCYCPWCPTDVLYEVTRIPEEVFAKVDISVIRDLGPRGDHRSRIWESQAYEVMCGRLSDRQTGPFDRNANYTFHTESLHDVWEEAEGLAKVDERFSELTNEEALSVSMLNVSKLRKGADADESDEEDMGEGLFD